MTEDEIVGGGHHQLDGREFEQSGEGTAQSPALGRRAASFP